MNYLRPDVKRGNFSLDEDELIIKLHSLLGNRYRPNFLPSSAMDSRKEASLKLQGWHLSFEGSGSKHAPAGRFCELSTQKT